MAHSERLKSWLLDHSGSLNLQLKQFDWFHDWGLENFCDLQISIEISGQIFVGRGTATSEDDAILKAGAEALERAYTAGNSVHSTGVAVHTDEKLAQLNARLELNERASFFGHFFTATPFERIHLEHWADLKTQYQNAFVKLNLLKTDIAFFTTKNARGIPTYICIATDRSENRTWGGVIGLSAKTEKAQAIQSAFFECLRSVAALHILSRTETLTERDFLMIQNPTSFDRQKLARNVDYWNTLGMLFPVKPSEINFDRHRELFPSYVQRLECPFKEIKTAPLFTYRAAPSANGDLNSLIEKPDPMTLGWLSAFFGETITPSQVARRPHFLG